MNGEQIIKIMQDEIKEVKKRIQELPSIYQMKLAIKEGVDKAIKESKEVFVSKEEFKPVRIIVYGAAGAAGLAIITAVISLILK